MNNNNNNNNNTSTAKALPPPTKRFKLHQLSPPRRDAEAAAAAVAAAAAAAAAAAEMRGPMVQPPFELDNEEAEVQIFAARRRSAGTEEALPPPKRLGATDNIDRELQVPVQNIGRRQHAGDGRGPAFEPDTDGAGPVAAEPEVDDPFHDNMSNHESEGEGGGVVVEAGENSSQPDEHDTQTIPSGLGGREPHSVNQGRRRPRNGNPWWAWAPTALFIAFLACILVLWTGDRLRTVPEAVVRGTWRGVDAADEGVLQGLLLLNSSDTTQRLAATAMARDLHTSYSETEQRRRPELASQTAMLIYRLKNLLRQGQDTTKSTEACTAAAILFASIRESHRRAEHGRAKVQRIIDAMASNAREAEQAIAEEEAAGQGVLEILLPRSTPSIRVSRVRDLEARIVLLRDAAVAFTAALERFSLYLNDAQGLASHLGAMCMTLCSPAESGLGGSVQRLAEACRAVGTAEREARGAVGDGSQRDNGELGISFRGLLARLAGDDAEALAAALAWALD